MKNWPFRVVRGMLAPCANLLQSDTLLFERYMMSIVTFGVYRLTYLWLLQEATISPSFKLRTKTCRGCIRPSRSARWFSGV
jgi:hypothetical protein